MNISYKWKLYGMTKKKLDFVKSDKQKRKEIRQQHLNNNDVRQNQL